MKKIILLISLLLISNVIACQTNDFNSNENNTICIDSCQYKYNNQWINCDSRINCSISIYSFNGTYLESGSMYFNDSFYYDLKTNQTGVYLGKVDCFNKVYKYSSEFHFSIGSRLNPYQQSLDFIYSLGEKIWPDNPLGGEFILFIILGAIILITIKYIFQKANI